MGFEVGSRGILMISHVRFGMPRGCGSKGDDPRSAPLPPHNFDNCLFYLEGRT